MSDSFKWLRDIGEGRDGVRTPTFGSPGEVRFIDSSYKLWNRMVAVIEAAKAVFPAFLAEETYNSAKDFAIAMRSLERAIKALEAARKEVEG